jgi:hypothetical protein
MATQGNFLDFASSTKGVDVGVGKMILVFGSQYQLSVTQLTTTGIQELITNGTIIGVIKDWHTITGAPVAEVSVERPLTSSMKLIRQEVAADTLTFEANLLNRDVLADLVGAGDLDCFLLDDIGNIWGEKYIIGSVLKSMKINFSGKVSNMLQSDNATDKTISVTARYLLKDFDFLATSIEPELIEPKEKLMIELDALAYDQNDGCTVDFFLKKRRDGLRLSGAANALTAANFAAIMNGHVGTISTVTYTAATGSYSVNIKSPIKYDGYGSVKLRVTNDDKYYMEEVQLTNADY